LRALTSGRYIRLYLVPDYRSSDRFPDRSINRTDDLLHRSLHEFPSRKQASR